MFSAEQELESGSELETTSQKDDFSSLDFDCKLLVPEIKTEENQE